MIGLRTISIKGEPGFTTTLHIKHTNGQYMFSIFNTNISIWSWIEPSTGLKLDVKGRLKARRIL